MKVDGSQHGPMADWPEVTETDGVVEALENLLGQVKMAVGTNAGDSNATLVWKALRRVGLGEYFCAVFTSQELGHAKPQTGFFRQIESVLAEPPYHMVMIGDRYSTDILGAKTAGWKAVWYNPGCQAAPGAIPLHNAEITNMRELPRAVRQLGLPDYTTCLAWLGEKGAPYNLLAHVNLVASVAYSLAVWLKSKGQDVDPVLAHRGGLLHDLSKMESLRRYKEVGDNRSDHAAMASEILAQRGQTTLARIANRHMPYSDSADPRRPETWEEKLVHFADKLAEGARLVDPTERLAALKIRYPHAAGELDASLPRLIDLQEEICAGAGLPANDLVERLSETLGFSH